MRMAKPLLDAAHVWILPHSLEPTWFHIEEETIAFLPSHQNCSNEEMLAIINTTNILHLDFMKYNVFKLPQWETFPHEYQVVSI